jgi:hypothetical protein
VYRVNIRKNGHSHLFGRDPGFTQHCDLPVGRGAAMAAHARKNEPLRAKAAQVFANGVNHFGVIADSAAAGTDTHPHPGANAPPPWRTLERVCRRLRDIRQRARWVLLPNQRQRGQICLSHRIVILLTP